MSIENPTLVHFRHFRHFSSLLTNLPSTLVENALQITPFYAKRTQFPKSQMNVTSFITTDYENNSNWTLGENEPNSNPIKANLKRAKMDVNSSITKDYENISDWTLGENKPNTKPIKAKQSQYKANTKPKKANTNPIQSQYKPNTKPKKAKKMLLSTFLLWDI